MRTERQMRIVRPAELDASTPAGHWGVESRFLLRDPERLVFQVCQMEPGGGAELDAHVEQDQIFLVLDGRLHVASGDGPHLAVSEGEALLIPAGAPHATVNDDAGPARYLVLTYPAATHAPPT